MNTESTPRFKARARLINQIGDQLIKSESIALMELVKNAYDADSPDCTVVFDSPDSKELGSIIIEDHGEGMNSEILNNVWLEVGTSFKSDKKRENYRTKRFHRRPLGEKGIGRFGVHRLGLKIYLISKMDGYRECELSIDWEKIEGYKYLEDYPVFVKENRNPLYFKNGTGTKIIISRLRNPWTRGSLREVARQINSLNSPFRSDDSFKTEIKCNNDWLDGLLSFYDIKDKSLYSFNACILGCKVIEFNYSFHPYKTLDKVSSRMLGMKDFEMYSQIINNNGEEVDLSKYSIGTVLIEGLVFDLDTQVLNIGLPSGKKELKDYLRANGGIRVFRDNMRIWSYGESDNDWLELDAKRINRPSYKLSNRLIIAAVYLNGEKSCDLVEKANREGFIENDAFFAFKDACNYVIDKIEFFRNQDKERLRGMYFHQTKSIPVINSVEEIRALAKSKIADQETVNEISEKLDRISEEYTRVTENLLKSAGAGLNLVAVLHQIEKIVKNIKSSLDDNPSYDNIISYVDSLVSLVSGYSLLVRNSDTRVQPIDDLIFSSIQNCRFRFIAHKIKVDYNYKTNTHFAYCSESFVMNALMNLFDNSIWWLSYSKRIDPRIQITISDFLEGYWSIIVADNGPGFGALSEEELKAPFVSTKPPGVGMGIGLHLTNAIMESLGGKMLFPNAEDLGISGEFASGAIVLLAFKKEK